MREAHDSVLHLAEFCSSLLVGVVLAEQLRAGDIESLFEVDNSFVVTFHDVSIFHLFFPWFVKHDVFVEETAEKAKMTARLSFV